MDTLLSHAEHPALKISIFRLALISEPPNEGSLHPVPRYKVKCLRARLAFRPVSTARPPSSLIQAEPATANAQKDGHGADFAPSFRHSGASEAEFRMKYGLKSDVTD